jgi:hypothetical protein
MVKLNPLKKAMRILEKYQIWWDMWDDVREHVLSRNAAAARRALLEDHKLKPRDADHIMEWLEGSIHGTRVNLVEIPISSIRYPTDEEATDEEDTDPFAQPRYLARRGVYIDKMETSQWNEGRKTVRKVWFKNRNIDPRQLDQVWEIMPVVETIAI